MTYLMVEQIQILTLLTLIKSFFPIKLMWFFRLMSVFLMKFHFLGISNSIFGPVSEKYSQKIEVMDYLGFKSTQAFRNIADNLIVFGSIFIIHVLFFQIYMRVYRKSTKFSSCHKISIIFKKTFRRSIYLRFIMLSFILYLVSIFSELNQGKVKSQPLSTSFALFILFLLVVLTLIPGIVVVRMLFMKDKVLPLCLVELFRGILPKIIPEFFPFLNLFKKILL